jgi:dTMP kinase
MAGRFITIEGIEGVGKTTNVEFIADFFRQQGDTVRVTREPGGTELAEKIRNLILETPRDGLSDTGELLLMFAARAEHLHSLIRPALVNGDTVICDRFIDATYAYQGGGRGMSVEAIATLQRLVQGELPGTGRTVLSRSGRSFSAGFATPTCKGPLRNRSASNWWMPVSPLKRFRRRLKKY